MGNSTTRALDRSRLLHARGIPKSMGGSTPSSRVTARNDRQDEATVRPDLLPEVFAALHRTEAEVRAARLLK